MASVNCSTNDLAGLLDESLSSEQAATLESHLETCRYCRDELQRLAGEKELFSSLSCLSDDDLDYDWARTSPTSNDYLGGQSVDPGHPSAVLNSIQHLLAPTDEPKSLGRIGGYEVTGIIGCGGMGVVLKARDPMLDRVVAIKLLAPHLALHENEKKRFLREAKTAATIKHEGIIPIYAIDTHHGSAYFVMPYEAGPSLKQRIDADGRLSVEEALRVTAQLASALAAAHQSGLVHRDIKPSNILLAPGTERALLADFGLAQANSASELTMTGLLAGTPLFMSPEQARGEPVDSRSDLFSLGSVLFVMLTGTTAVRGDSPYSVVSKIGREPMPRPSEVDSRFDGWIDELVSLLHQFDKEKRVQSASEFEVLVNDCLAHLKNPKECPVPSQLKSRRPNKRIRLTAAGGCIALVLVALVYSISPFFHQWLNSFAPSDANPNGKSSVSSNPVEMDGHILQWDDRLDGTLDEIRQRISRLEKNEFDATN